MEKQTVNVEKLFNAVLKKLNEAIDKLESLDPSTQAYEQTLKNIATSFSILQGATLKEKEGK